MAGLLNIVGVLILLASVYSAIRVLALAGGLAGGGTFGDAFRAGFLSGGLGASIEGVLLAVGFFAAAAVLSRLDRLVELTEHGPEAVKAREADPHVL